MKMRVCAELFESKDEIKVTKQGVVSLLSRFDPELFYP
jgi:hypothetical protein